MRPHTSERGIRRQQLINAGYRSHDMGPVHPRRGEKAGLRSSGAREIPLSHTIFDVATAPVRRVQTWHSGLPEYDIVSPGKLLTLQLAATILPGSTFPAAVIVGFDYPTSTVGQIEAVSSLVAGAAASAVVNWKYARSVI